MPAWAYDTGPNGLWVFLIVTLVLGGAAAFVSGRVVAQTWRPVWQIPLYVALLTVSVRFVQFSVFGAPLFSLRNAAVDFAALFAICVAGYRLTRVDQMRHQYGWKRTSP